jgi:hypothetical protein
MLKLFSSSCLADDDILKKIAASYTMLLFSVIMIGVLYQYINYYKTANVCKE